MRLKDFLVDARSNPAQNIKYKSVWDELADWRLKNKVSLVDLGEWGVSMTYLPKLGINPGQGISEDTPRGIYFYPIRYIWKMKMNGSRVELPWADNAPYIQVFRYSPSKNNGLHNPHDIPLAKAVEELKKYGITDEIIANEKEEHSKLLPTYDLIVWCLGRKYNDDRRITLLNKILRNLGYDYLLDDGKGWIAPNERTQGVVLNPKIIDKVFTFNNYIRKRPPIK